MEFVIVRIGSAPAVAFENSFRIGIDDKTGVAAGVKQHTIGSLRADAVDGEEALSNRFGVALKKPFKACAVFVDDDVHKVAQPLGFDVEITGRSNELREFVVSKVVDFF